MKEFIICAANHYDDGKVHPDTPNNIYVGFVVCGRRHFICSTIFDQITGLDKDMEILSRKKAEKIKNTVFQGFLTNTNRLVGRKEAYKIAFEADQIIGPNKGCPTNEVGLTSEDLYFDIED